MSNRRASRSESHLSEDFQDSDDEHQDHEDGSTPAKPGRKKNPNSAAARRDQNRIAQREFRLRKQQRIRDLEARVEILSGSKDEAFSELRHVLKDLMAENQTLRTLVRGLSSFIGEGVGGVVPQYGFERPSDFIEFINRAETDTAFEGFQVRKKAAAAAAAATVNHVTSVHANSVVPKRAADDLLEDTRSKRPATEAARNGVHGKDLSTMPGRADSDITGRLMLPGMSSSATSSFYSSATRSTAESGLFQDLLHGGSNGPAPGPVYAPSPTSDNAFNTPNGNPMSVYSPVFHSPASLPGNVPAQSFVASSSTSVSPTSASKTATADYDQIEDPKLQEANKLIQYHMDNYKRNNAYCLPQSLRPTLVQRTVPHESVIDFIPHPELRDRMILLRARFDIVDCLHEYVRSVTLHGDDVLAHSNWELSEKWLKKYGFLIDQPVLNTCNRWRRERGEPELTLADINPSGEAH